MNNARRKALSGLFEQLTCYKDRFEELQYEEQEAYDNMPESLQESERGQTACECVDSFDNTMSVFEDLLSEFEELLNY